MGAVAETQRYKNCYYFSSEFVADYSWNGYENNLLYENLGSGKFTDVARGLGCDEVKDSRGLAVADLNNDGLMDMVVGVNAEPPTIFINRMKSAGNFIQVNLTSDEQTNRDAIGAKVQVTFESDSGPRTLTRWRKAGSGFCSQADSRLHFGLGESAELLSVKVTWPDGQEAELSKDQLVDRINSQIGIKKQWAESNVLQSTTRGEQ